MDKQGNATAAPPELLVNQFVSSTLTWPEEGLQLNQTASLHASNGTATSTLTVTRTAGSNSSDPLNATVTLKIRVPGWVVPEGSSLTLNGKQWEWCRADGLRADRTGQGLQPSSYCVINRAWSSGEVPCCARTGALCTQAQAGRREQGKPASVQPMLAGTITVHDWSMMHCLHTGSGPLPGSSSSGWL